jgi:hypothetical protein
MALTAIVVDDSAVSRALLKRGLSKAGVRWWAKPARVSERWSCTKNTAQR